MKSVNLGVIGGIPITQTRMAYLQAAWTEAIQGLALAGANGYGIFAISGCAITSVLVSGSVYAYTVSAGWLFYQGNMIRVPGNTVNVDTSSNSAYIQLTPTSAPLIYNNSVTENVINDVTASLISQPNSTPDSPTLFLANELGSGLPGLFASVAGLNSASDYEVRQIAVIQGQIATIMAEIAVLTPEVVTLMAQMASVLTLPAWTNIASSLTGGFVASVAFPNAPRITKKVNGEVCMQGAIDFSFGGYSPVFYQLPVGYRPSQKIYISVCSYANSAPGAYEFLHTTILIDTAGNMSCQNYYGSFSFLTLFLDNVKFLTL